MAKSSDSTLLLLLLGGAFLLMSSKAKAKAPTKPLDEEDVEADPRGIVIPGEPTLIRTPVWPEGEPLTERPIADSAMDAAKAAAAAAESLTRNPLYPSIPSSSSAQPLPPIQAAIEQVPAPAAQQQQSYSSSGPNLPVGYDPAAARRGARALVNHLKRAGKANYDRRLLESWQRQAGLVPDRIYGGGTRGALLFYGASDAPAPFFKPFETIAYVPPERR